MTIVRWARHGQNEANLSQTLSYRIYDADLTELGRRQAAALAERLAIAPHPAPVIVCSPLRRAWQTADVVAARLGVPVAAVLEDLREINVGSLDGRRDAEAWRIYNEVLAAWSRGDLAARFPEGEDGTALVARVRRGVLAAAALAGKDPPADRGEGRSALVVAHGGNIRAAFHELTGAPEPAADLPTGGSAVLDVGADSAITVLEWPVPPMDAGPQSGFDGALTDPAGAAFWIVQPPTPAEQS